MPCGFLGGRNAQSSYPSLQKRLFAQMLCNEHIVYIFEALQAHFLGSLNTSFILCEISPRKNPIQRTIQFLSFASKILELLLNNETTIVEYTCLTKFLWHSPRCKKEKWSLISTLFLSPLINKAGVK